MLLPKISAPMKDVTQNDNFFKTCYHLVLDWYTYIHENRSSNIWYLTVMDIVL